MEPFDIHKTILGFFRPKEDEEGAAVAGGQYLHLLWALWSLKALLKLSYTILGSFEPK